VTRSALRSVAAVLTTTVVVASTASLIGCASYGPAARVAVQDVKTLTGTWRGTVYRSGFEPESVELAIHDDGSYDVVSSGPGGTSRGRGKIVVSDGRLLVEGQKGRGTGTLVRSPAGDLVLNVDMILNDNSALSAKLWPNR
jgi:hypothetical protein